METVTVKMGEVKVTREGMLVTFGVGSCVAIVLFDSQAHIGGMAHTMLTIDRATKTQLATNPLRYVELAIPILIEEMIRAGAAKRNLRAFLTGGAQMFSLYRTLSNAIGPSNIVAAKRALQAAAIPILQEETGGAMGRNVHFDTMTGDMTIDAKG